MTELLNLSKKELRKEVAVRRKSWQIATSYDGKMETMIAYNRANNLYQNNSRNY